MMQKACTVLNLVGLWLASTLVIDAQVEAPDSEHFYRRGSNQIAVLGDFVYIDGGDIEQYVEGSTEPLFSAVNSTLSLPINISWDNETVRLREIDRGERPRIIDFNFWTDTTGNRLYQWDGGGLESAQDVVIWAFTPDDTGGGEWETADAANPSVFGDLLRMAGGAGVVCDNMAYIVGGMIHGWTDARIDREGDTPFFVPGMVSLNMTSHEWRNQSLAKPSDYYIRGKASCVQGLGDGSYIFAIGGLTAQPGGEWRPDSAMVDMGNITFYDPSTEVWRWQQTSGETPPGRYNHCLVGARSSQGVFDLYVYGGYNKLEGAMDDFWILSLPAFRWFRIEGQHPRRITEACAIVGQSQIIFVGEQGSKRIDTRDEFSQGIGVFDMMGLEWSSGYRADADEYRSPDFVTNWYDSGGLNEVDWNSQDVRALFAPNSTATSTPEPSSDSSPSIGAIAGGVVGGVLFLLAIGALVFWLLRRRAKQRLAKLSKEDLMHCSKKPELENIERQRSNLGSIRLSTKFELWGREIAELPSITRPAELDSGSRGHGRPAKSNNDGVNSRQKTRAKRRPAPEPVTWI